MDRSTLASGGDLDAASLEVTRITRKHPGGGGLSVAIARQTSHELSCVSRCDAAARGRDPPGADRADLNVFFTS